jgi:hypothetical protein
VWAPNSPTEGGCDTFPFCIYAKLAFSVQPATSNDTSTLVTTTITGSSATTIVNGSDTTIVQGNATTIVRSSTTTIIHGITTNVVYPPENGSYAVAVFAFVQDAVTGQNVTTGGGQSYIAADCNIQPTGFTECIAGGSVPAGHTYKITVFVTKGDLPCSIRPANDANLYCTSQLLAPVSPTITVTE